MTSKNFEAEQSPADVDMSADAVTNRLKRVSQLRRLCIALGNAKVKEATEFQDGEADVLLTSENSSQ
ncbi:MAG TPA: hypothetical protein VF074_07615 [Pyrinomonadaceae bacterium]